MLKNLIYRLRSVIMLVIVTMLWIAGSILELQYRMSTNEIVGQKLEIDPYLFAVAMILGAFFIFIRYIIMGKEINTWRETLYYALAMLPLTYYCLYYGVYLLVTSYTKTTGIFLIMFWGFLLTHPLRIRRGL